MTSREMVKMLTEIEHFLIYSCPSNCICLKNVLLCTLTRSTAVINKNCNERSVSDGLGHVHTGELGFICRSGFDAQKVADFPQHQIENFLII